MSEFNDDEFEALDLTDLVDDDLQPSVPSRVENRNPNVEEASGQKTVNSCWTCAFCTTKHAVSSARCTVCNQPAPESVKRHVKKKWQFMNGYSQQPAATTSEPTVSTQQTAAAAAAATTVTSTTTRRRIATTSASTTNNFSSVSTSTVTAVSSSSPTQSFSIKASNRRNNSPQRQRLSVGASETTTTSSILKAHNDLAPRSRKIGGKQSKGERRKNQTRLCPASSSDNRLSFKSTDDDPRAALSDNFKLPPATVSDFIDDSDTVTPRINAETKTTWEYPVSELYQPRKYQVEIVRRSLFQNTLVTLPTGMGKTLIAAVVMYNFYRWFPDGKIIFMAPTKPLVEQQARLVWWNP